MGNLSSKKVICITSLIILLSCSGSCFAENKKYYRLFPLWTLQTEHLINADLNNDGYDEFCIQEGQQLDIKNWKLNHYYKSFKAGIAPNYYITPIATGNIDSIYYEISYQSGDTIYYKLLCPSNPAGSSGLQLKDLCKFVKDPNAAMDTFYQSAGPLDTFSMPGNDNLIVMTLNCAFYKQGLRGIRIIDIINQTIKWQYLYGPYMYNSVFEDINNDGYDEAIIGTYAPANGICLNGTCDDSSYVFVINNDGTLKWKMTVGPYWTGAHVDLGDFDGSGNKKLVIFRISTTEDNGQQDFISLAEPLTGTIIKSKFIGDRFTSIPIHTQHLVKDMNGDGRDEIVLGNTDGFVRILDGSLSVLYQSKPYKKPVFVWGVEDLDGDKQCEIICKIKDEKIIILDNTLTQLFEYKGPITHANEIGFVNVGNHKNILLKNYDAQLTHFTLLEMQESLFPFAKENLYTNSLFINLLIGLVSFSFAALLFISISRRKIAVVFKDCINQLPNKENVLLLAQNYSIIFAGTNWQKALNLHNNFYGKRIPAALENSNGANYEFYELFSARLPDGNYKITIRQDNNPVELQVNSKYYPAYKYYCLVLTDMSDVEYVRQLKQWANVAQDLAHRIKSPLTTITLNSQELLYHIKEKYGTLYSETEEFIQSILEQADKLRRMADSFMHFVIFDKAVPAPADLNTEIQYLVSQYLPRTTNKVKINWDLEENLPQAIIDKQQFNDAFSNIFFNAIESTNDNGILVISSRQVELYHDNNNNKNGDHYIELQIQDNGCGIEPEYLDKIMEPWFTRKKNGTGLGLTRVQQIMQNHEGQIKIHSQKGIGTTVTLRFKRAE